jgi:DNA polymerase-3 subunit delta
MRASILAKVEIDNLELASSPMKHELAKVIADAKNGKGPRCLLLYGDDLQVQESREWLIDQLISTEQRSFNLERFDGRSTPWEQVQGALMTPPFFPAIKVVWVEDAPYFISRDQKGEMGEKILKLWSDGKREEAGKLLIELLVVEGWSEEQWQRLMPGASNPLAKLLGVDEGTGRQEIDALLAFCKTQGIDLSRRRPIESTGLADLLERGLPEWSFLLLTAVHVDRRTRLYKRVEQIGGVLQLELERDRTGKISRDGLLEFVNARVNQAGKTLEPKAREMIVQRAPGDLRNLSHELAKLCLYAADRPVVRASDVEAVMADYGEGWVFELTRAVGEGDAVTALSELARLLLRGEPALKLLATMASEARRLLAARQLLDCELRGRWRRGMSFAQFQQQIQPSGTPLLTRNPYGDYMCLLRAERFSMKQLRRYMDGLHDADLRLKSSGGNPRVVLERAILGLCLPVKVQPGTARAMR